MDGKRRGLFKSRGQEADEGEKTILQKAVEGGKEKLKEEAQEEVKEQSKEMMKEKVKEEAKKWRFYAVKGDRDPNDKAWVNFNFYVGGPIFGVMMIGALFAWLS